LDVANVTDRGYWIGFDLGGTKMLSGVFDSEFRRVGGKRRKTRGHEGVSAGLERIVRTIADALKDAPTSVGLSSRGLASGVPDRWIWNAA
jgi:glucokinase